MLVSIVALHPLPCLWEQCCGRGLTLLLVACRPVMHMGGELDGQARFARMAFPAMEAAACADHFGRRSAPFLSLEAAKHLSLADTRWHLPEQKECHGGCTQS